MCRGGSVGSTATTAGLTVLLLCSVSLAVWASREGKAREAEGLGAHQWLQRAEAARPPLENTRLRLRVTTVDNNRLWELAELDVFFGAGNRMLIVFRSGRQAGRSILVVGERVWLIVQGARNPIPVTRQQRLAGALSIADLGHLRLAEDYEARLRKERQTVRGVRCAVLELEGRRRGIPYPSATLWLDEETYLPYRLLLRLPAGKAARQIDFVGYERQGCGFRLRTLEVRDLLKRKATPVRVEILSYEPFQSSPELFTPEGAKTVPRTRAGGDTWAPDPGRRARPAGGRS